MEQKKLDRINELSKKSKTTGLNEEEKKEQELLRSEYIALFRRNMKAQLDEIRGWFFKKNRNKIKLIKLKGVRLCIA